MLYLGFYSSTVNHLSNAVFVTRPPAKEMRPLPRSPQATAALPARSQPKLTLPAMCFDMCSENGNEHTRVTRLKLIVLPGTNRHGILGIRDAEGLFARLPKIFAIHRPQPQVLSMSQRIRYWSCLLFTGVWRVPRLLGSTKFVRGRFHSMFAISATFRLSKLFADIGANPGSDIGRAGDNVCCPVDQLYVPVMLRNAQILPQVTQPPSWWPADRNSHQMHRQPKIHQPS